MLKEWKRKWKGKEKEIQNVVGGEGDENVDVKTKEKYGLETNRKGDETKMN